MRCRLFLPADAFYLHSYVGDDPSHPCRKVSRRSTHPGQPGGLHRAVPPAESFGRRSLTNPPLPRSAGKSTAAPTPLRSASLCKTRPRPSRQTTSARCASSRRRRRGRRHRRSSWRAGTCLCSPARSSCGRGTRGWVSRALGLVASWCPASACDLAHARRGCLLDPLDSRTHLADSSYSRSLVHRRRSLSTVRRRRPRRGLLAHRRRDVRGLQRRRARLHLNTLATSLVGDAVHSEAGTGLPKLRAEQAS